MRNLGNLYSSRDYASHDHVVGGSSWRSFAKSFGGKLGWTFPPVTYLIMRFPSLFPRSRVRNKYFVKEMGSDEACTGGMYKREDEGVSFSRIRRQPLLNILFNFITSDFPRIHHLYNILGFSLLLGFGQILNVCEYKLTEFEFHFEYSDPGFESLKVGVIVNIWSTQDEYSNIYKSS